MTSDPKNAALNLIDKGYYIEAEEKVRGLLIESDDYDLHYLLGSALSAQQKYTDAKVEFEKGISLDPDGLTMKGQLARVAWLAGHIREAGQRLKALYDEGERDQSITMLGTLMLEDRDNRTAVILFNRIKSTSSCRLGALVGKSKAYIRLNDRSSALNALEAAWSVDQTNVWVIAAKQEFEITFQTKFVSSSGQSTHKPVETRSPGERSDDAEGSPHASDKPVGPSPRILCNRAFHDLDVKDYASSIENFTRAIELSPTHLNSYAGRAKAYYELKDYERATSDLSIIISNKYNLFFALNLKRAIALRTFHLKDLVNAQKGIWSCSAAKLEKMKVVAYLLDYMK